MKLDIKAYFNNSELLDKQYRPVIANIENICAKWNVNVEFIHSIILTDNIKQAIYDINEEYGLAITPTDEKEYVAVAKFISIPSDDSSNTCIIAQWMADNINLFSETLILLLLTRYYEDGIQVEDIVDETTEDMLLSKFVLGYVREWIGTYRAFRKLKEHGMHIGKNMKDMTDVTQAFMRGMKRAHWQYKMSVDHETWSLYSVNYVSDYLARCLECELRGSERSGLRQFEKPVTFFIQEVGRLSDALDCGKLCDTSNIDTVFHEILLLSGVRIDLDAQRGIWVEGNPKFLFREELKETEPRIVAVIDILGFKEKIYSYDANKYSTLLREISDAMHIALQVTVDIMKKQSEEYERLLDYRMYSDNLCISLPYYDDDGDFASQLFIIITIVRTYQNVLLQSNIMVRGGITIGAYYSDNNMIFSSALIEAHEVEQVTGMPRVSLSPRIVERILEMEGVVSDTINMSDMLLYDKYDNTVFVNPFGLNNKLIESIDSLSSAYEIHVLSPLREAGNTEMVEMLEKATVLFDYVRETAQKKVQEYDYEAIIISRLTNEMSELEAVNRDNLGAKNPVYEKYSWMLDLLLWSKGEDGVGRFENFVSAFMSKQSDGIG